MGGQRLKEPHRDVVHTGKASSSRQRALPAKFSRLLHLPTPSYSARSLSLLWAQEKFTLGRAEGVGPKQTGSLYGCICVCV